MNVNKSFWNAVKDSNRLDAIAAVHKGADINCLDDDLKVTAATFAVCKEATLLLKALLKLGASVSVRGEIAAPTSSSSASSSSSSSSTSSSTSLASYNNKKVCKNIHGVTYWRRGRGFRSYSRPPATRNEVNDLLRRTTCSALTFAAVYGRLEMLHLIFAYHNNTDLDDKLLLTALSLASWTVKPALERQVNKMLLQRPRLARPEKVLLMGVSPDNDSKDLTLVVGEPGEKIIKASSKRLKYFSPILRARWRPAVLRNQNYSVRFPFITANAWSAMDHWMDQLSQLVGDDRSCMCCSSGDSIRSASCRAVEQLKDHELLQSFDFAHMYLMEELSKVIKRLIMVRCNWISIVMFGVKYQETDVLKYGIGRAVADDFRHTEHGPRKDHWLLTSDLFWDLAARASSRSVNRLTPFIGFAHNWSFSANIVSTIETALADEILQSAAHGGDAFRAVSQVILCESFFIYRNYKLMIALLTVNNKLLQI